MSWDQTDSFDRRVGAIAVRLRGYWFAHKCMLKQPLQPPAYSHLADSQRAANEPD